MTSSKSAPSRTSPSSAAADRPPPHAGNAPAAAACRSARSIRASVIAIVLSVTLSFSPGSSVTTSPTFSGRNGCSASGRAACRTSASATASTLPGTENGMILIVAIRSFGATTA